MQNCFLIILIIIEKFKKSVYLWNAFLYIKHFLGVIRQLCFAEFLFTIFIRIKTENMLYSNKTFYWLYKHHYTNIVAFYVLYYLF